MGKASGILVLALLSAVALSAGCGGASKAPIAPGSFSLSWRIGSGIRCNATTANLSSVDVTVLQGAKEIATKQFACGEGLTGAPGVNPAMARFDGMNPGTYEVKLDGKDATSAQRTFSGTKTGVTVVSGKDTDAGEVRIAQIPPESNRGPLTIFHDFADGRHLVVCTNKQLGKVKVEAYLNEVSLKLEKSYDCNPTSLAIEQLPIGNYGIVAEAADSQGIVKYRGTLNVVLDTSGSTANIVLHPL